MDKHFQVVHIDDNAGDLTLIHEAFADYPQVAHLGVEEVIQAIGKLAESVLAGKAPSMILLDLNLCGMDGLEVMTLLNANPHLRRIPVVVLTASDRCIDRDECIRLGAKGFITKPATYEGMREAVKGVVHLLTASGAKAAVARSGAARVVEADAATAPSATPAAPAATGSVGAPSEF